MSLNRVNGVQSESILCATSVILCASVVARTSASR